MITVKDLLQQFKELNEDEIYEMSNLRKSETGSIGILWITHKKPSAHSESPYIKVQNSNSDKVIGDPSTQDPHWASMSISDNPTVLVNTLDKDIEDSARKFVIKNKDLLLDFYNGKILFIGEFLSKVQKIQPPQDIKKLSFDKSFGHIVKVLKRANGFASVEYSDGHKETLSLGELLPLASALPNNKLAKNRLIQDLEIWRKQGFEIPKFQWE